MKRDGIHSSRWIWFALLVCLQFPSLLMAQQSTPVSGKVVGANGEAIPGANVVVKGTSTGTSTNAQGNFSLNAPSDGTLVISSLGFVSQDVAIGRRSQLTVTLAEDRKALEEVVVVGYGTQRKSDVTGSLSSVTAKEIKSVPVTGVGQALQGRAAGVQVTQASNAPGGGVTIRIRGGNSINAGNEPLYVIDGFPVYNESGANLNPNDIESMEILKDASATAIYGSRGANGVVLITTKRGKSGQNRIEFETYYGVQQVRKKLPLLNATQYAT
ncbi:MAG: SusC/RagA family TonB-linked outer membrane protein, partial [Cytophagaceae bacterium]